ncbi:uncharacterized protein Z518_05811 [Rhinocladiella mackenziei CBS 650.93]|uniref:Rhinocladiella mackenziei CBS 650.93 unplaced genomic scaffold supercont1.4, whole genome shotgun sequence n=1 Tax=Rhinocladiella mackenziei CBS 650.93 TaxID=1442369 RepID=A0A0D2J781_9EURO|nr:uncharacterized protein Z518_05811 [Rhinocladiella mackenziei CBS 650.93]KIX04940.1 hypothetical protein Z518_05811 [Rhinocladiella mackenziei CBS 650.93]
MLCDDCRELIRQADRAFTSSEDSSHSAVKREVTTTEFQTALHGKCYLCTRLLIQLGDAKWWHILSDLPDRNLVAFDKSASCHPPSLILGPLSSPKPPPPIFEEVKSATTTSDPRVLDLIVYWLESCTSPLAHPLCNRQIQQPLSYPSRLIDVAPENTPAGYWRLVEVAMGHITGPYMTLSHRWGSGTVKLEHRTQADMLRGMPLSVLPGTYQDAIRVARHLAVRYLWIDSMCIFQDERLDIQKEASRMAEVFGNALGNISALSGKHDGLFCTRSPELVNSDSVLLNQDGLRLNRSYLMNDLQLWRGELLHMPLTTRGWVLQEEVLAPRTIYFGARQVLWDCAEFRACETYPFLQRKMPLQQPAHFNQKHQFLHDEEIAPITSVLQVARASLHDRDHDHASELFLPGQQQMLFDVWTRFVAHYSLRVLTFPVDKLLAIAGVSKLFGMVMRDRSVAGLWRLHLMEGLLWYIRMNTSTSPPAAYRAPSWSWAASDGYVIHAEPFNTSWTVARALNIECQTVGGDEFGMVASAKLEIQAPCLHMSVDEQGEWTASYLKYKVPRLIVRLDTTEGFSSTGEFLGVIIRTTAYRLTDNQAGPGMRIRTAASTNKILLAAQGIIITPAGHRQHLGIVGAEYRRIGYFALEDRKSGSLTPKWVPEDCRIFPEPQPQPSRSEDGQGQGNLKEFEFDKPYEHLRVLEII